MEGRFKPSKLPGDDHQCRMQFLLDIKPKHGSEHFSRLHQILYRNHHGAMCTTVANIHITQNNILTTDYIDKIINNYKITKK